MARPTFFNPGTRWCGDSPKRRYKRCRGAPGNKEVVVLRSWLFGPADAVAEGVARASGAWQSSMEHVHVRSNLLNAHIGI
jgi:hypothetical protein